MAKAKAVKAGVNLVRDIAEEVGENLSRKVAPARPKSPWGWKGNKPGEPSADELKNLMYKESTPGWLDTENVDYVENEVFNRFAEKYPRSEYGRYWDMVNAENGLEPSFHDSFNANVDLVNNFLEAQAADIPREWTGRVVGQATINPFRRPDYEKISSLMRNMDDESREMFVQLMPDWDGSLDELAETVANLLS